MQSFEWGVTGMKTLLMTLTLLLLAWVGTDAMAEVRRPPPVGADTAVLAQAQAKAEMEEKVASVSAARDVAVADAKKQSAQLAELKRQNDELQKRNDVLKGRLSEMLDSATKGQANQTAMSEKLQKDRERVQEMVAKFRDTVQVLKQVESERTELKTNLEQRNRLVAECVARNDELYKANLDVLEKYNSKGVWQALTEREPLTQIQHVKNETWSEEFRRKNDQGHQLGSN